MSKITLSQIIRFPSDSEPEVLNFSSGVNVLVGRPNTGKSTWVEMIDVLMCGKLDSLDDDIREKYDGLRGHLVIAGTDVTLERMWKRKGMKTKIIYNGEALKIDECQYHLLDMLGIDRVSFPKGNPYNRTSGWQSLSLREVWRHVYRDQDSWASLVEKQSPNAQHACIMAFLGVAKTVLSSTYREMVEAELDRDRLTARHEQFHETLADVAQEVLGPQDQGSSPIEERIASAEKTLKNLAAQKEQLIRSRLNNTAPDTHIKSLQKLGEDRLRLQAELIRASKEQTLLQGRLSSLAGQLATLKAERDRLARTVTAEGILRDLPVSCCPACQQTVSHLRRQTVEPTCFLCHQDMESPQDLPSAHARVKFERKQVKSESDEIQRLIEESQTGLAATQSRRNALEHDLSSIARALESSSGPLASITHEYAGDISTIDVEVGYTKSRIENLNRILRAEESAGEIQTQIEKRTQTAKQLKEMVGQEIQTIDFTEESERISIGVSRYLEGLDNARPASWGELDTFMSLNKSSFGFTVGRPPRRWDSKLGGTKRLYFIMAYHYALLSLPSGHHPGLCILDLPAHLDGADVRDRENFVLAPFLELAQQHDFQLIVAGSAFEGLESDSRTELTNPPYG